MPTVNAEINPLLIAAVTGQDEKTFSEKPTPSMLPGKYGRVVYKSRKQFEMLNQPNKQSLVCRNCGKRAVYDIGTVVFDQDRYLKENKSATVHIKDYVQTTGYFRCKQCNGDGNWELPSNFFMNLTFSLMSMLVRQSSETFAFGEIVLYDGYKPRWATDGERHLLMKMINHGQDAFIWNRLGNLYNKGGRPDLAAVAFEQSINLDPAQVESHFSLGIILSEIGEFEQAAFHLRQMLIHASDYKLLTSAKLRELLAVGLQRLCIIHLDSDQVIPFIPLQDEMRKAKGINSQNSNSTDSLHLTLRSFEINPYETKSFYPLAEIYMGKQRSNKSKKKRNHKR